jgi:hypothetical protein
MLAPEKFSVDRGAMSHADIRAYERDLHMHVECALAKPVAW